MSFFGGVNDMATLLPGGRSVFNSSGPATATAQTAAAPSADPNAAAIANAAAALGTGSSSAATGTAASPFAAASNLNFAGSAAAAPVTAPTGTLPGGRSPTPWQSSGPVMGPHLASLNPRTDQWSLTPEQVNIGLPTSQLIAARNDPAFQQYKANENANPTDWVQQPNGSWKNNLTSEISLTKPAFSSDAGYSQWLAGGT